MQPPLVQKRAGQLKKTANCWNVPGTSDKDFLYCLCIDCRHLSTTNKWPRSIFEMRLNVKQYYSANLRLFKV